MSGNTRHRQVNRPEKFKNFYADNRYRYIDYIKTIKPLGLIGLYALDERMGITAYDKSGNKNHGTYRNQNMLDKDYFLENTTKTPQWKPANNDWLSFPSGFLTKFDLDEYCIILWFKVRSSSVWSDATVRQIIECNRDGSNRATIFRSTTNNQIQTRHVAGGVTKTISATISDINWNMFTIKTSLSSGTNGEFKAFLNSEQISTTQTSLGNKAGAITSSALGSQNNIGTNPFDGYLSHVAIWSGAGNLPSDSEVVYIYNFLA